MCPPRSCSGRDSLQADMSMSRACLRHACAVLASVSLPKPRQNQHPRKRRPGIQDVGNERNRKNDVHTACGLLSTQNRKERESAGLIS